MEPALFFGALIATAPAAVSSPLALAILSALGVLSAAFGVAQLQQPGLVQQRLGSFGEPARTLEELELELSFRERVLAPLIRGVSRVILRWTPASRIDGYRRKLVLAGGPGGMDVRDLLGAKGLTTLALGGASFLISTATSFGPSPLLMAIGLAGLGFYLPDLLLSRRIRRRQHEIQKALPDTLDLLTISVEAGLGFDAAIGRVVEKRSDELSAEFGRVLQEMRIGRSRRDALRSLIERTDVADVNTFVTAIVQSEQLGVPISRVLLTQAAQMRVRRRQRAEEAAHKAPIKMLFPMVFLIFPALFVVLLGPTIPNITRALGSG